MKKTNKIKFTLTLFLIVSFHSLFGQQIPNKFLGLMIGTSLDTFLESNPDAKEGQFWVLNTNISATGMTVYEITKSTSSGDKVQIDCCFKNSKLSIISVEYKDYQLSSDILSGLKTKYGKYSKRFETGYKDFMNGQYRSVDIFKWSQNPNYILEFDYTHGIGLAEIIFADKASQSKIQQRKQKQNKSKIE